MTHAALAAAMVLIHVASVPGFCRVRECITAHGALRLRRVAPMAESSPRAHICGHRGRVRAGCLLACEGGDGSVSESVEVEGHRARRVRVVGSAAVMGLNYRWYAWLCRPALPCGSESVSSSWSEADPRCSPLSPMMLSIVSDGRKEITRVHFAKPRMRTEQWPHRHWPLYR